MAGTQVRHPRLGSRKVDGQSIESITIKIPLPQAVPGVEAGVGIERIDTVI
jgi:hypothetical protein